MKSLAISTAITAFLTAFSTPVFAGSVVLPLQGIQRPASDLLYQGKTIDSDDATELAQKGQDVSRLDPVPGEFWNPEGKLPPVESLNYPQDGATLEHLKSISIAGGIARFRVNTPGPKGQSFVLSASLNSHAAIARAHLLKKLGYAFIPPRWYRKLTVRFNTLADRDRFVDYIIRATGTAQSRWFPKPEVQLPANQPIATIRDVVLEPGQAETRNLHWSVVPDYSGTTSNLPNERAFRALVLPLVFFDIPEQPDTWNTTVATIFDESIVLNHPDARSFQTTAREDVLWIARRIAALSEDDIASFIRAASYPRGRDTLLIQYALGRRNQLLETLFKREYPAFRYNLRISDGTIVDGKETREWEDDYAVRWTYGDPNSPIARDEQIRQLRLEGLAGLVNKATEKLNEALTIASVDDAIQKHTRQLIQKSFEDWKAGKTPAASEPIKVWGRGLLGFGLAANRHVVTGDYYGDETKAQVVDNLAVQAQVGYFAGIDGIRHVSPGILGNVVVQRNYIHVRPVANMSEAGDLDRSSMWIPNYMKQLGSNLSEEASTDSFKKLLDELKENEVLVITDSIAAGIQGQVTIPILNLLGLAPLKENPTVGLSSTGRATAYRRTTILRTANGIHVYLQNIKTKSRTHALDINWWIELFRASTSKRSGGTFESLPNRIYVLDKDDGGPDRDRRLARSIQNLLMHNSSETLEEDFRPYLFKHSLNAKVGRVDFLRKRCTTLEEGHILKVTPPGRGSWDKGEPFDPNDFERVFLNTRIENMCGISDMDLAAKAVKRITKGWALLPEGTGSDPANSVYGHSESVEISNEGEITEKPVDGKPLSPPITVLEHRWKGWSLSKQNLYAIFDAIEDSMAPLNIGYKLINRDEFVLMKELQVYNVGAALVIYPEGISKTRNLLLAGTPRDTLKFIMSLMTPAEIGEYKNWCETRQAPGAADMFGGQDMPVSLSMRDGGRRYDFPCLTKSMYNMLVLRQNYPGKGKLTLEHLKWDNQLLDSIQRKLTLDKLITLLGKENIFFQVRAQGFKTNVQNADITAAYSSSTVGRYQADRGAGALRELALRTKIQSHEIYARYLNEGY